MCSIVARTAASAFLACVCICSAALAEEKPVNMNGLDTVFIERGADRNVAAAARTFRQKLSELYKKEWKLVEAQPAGVPAGASGILLGRELALASGMITEQEIEAVKHDGFVIKAAGDRIALAGYDALGSTYAPFELLRRLGVQMVPWSGGLGGNTIYVMPTSPPAQLAALSLSDRPYFFHRDLLGGADAPIYGTTNRALRLADPKDGPDQKLFGRDRPKGYTKWPEIETHRLEWVGWDHTGPYLVPRDIYYETHPEYFAMENGKRIEPKPYMRMQICTTNPDVIRISTERALAWIEHLKHRLVFPITPADASMCDCPECRTLDPLPDYHADRALLWTNAVARAIAQKYPDKVIITYAYGDTVRPPLKVKPEPNVCVWYAPWFWNSRADSSFSLDHSVNVRAMKELAGWLAWCPGQVGIYDYPGDKAVGAAERTKMYARNGVRSIYYNGARGDYLLWLASRVMWDPFADLETLQESFQRAHYGPAAGSLGEYLRLRGEVSERNGVYGRTVIQPSPEYFRKVRALLEQAETQLDKADEGTRVRIAAGIIGAMGQMLPSTSPGAANAELRSDPDTYRKDLERFQRVSKLALDECDRLKLAGPKRQIESAVRSVLNVLNPPKETKTGPAAPPTPQLVFDRTVVDAVMQAATAAPAAPMKPRMVSVRFDGENEAAAWVTDATQAELISPAGSATVDTPAGPARGVQITAPLSKLPEVPWGNIKVHAGRFYAQRRFETPLDVEDCRFVDLHLNASCDVPVTLYLDKFRADFDLHAGEQIIRIDMRSYQRGGFDLSQWKQVESVALDIYPQDLFWPHPPARDATVTVLDLVVSNQQPTPDRLPYQGKVVWLTQYRPNVPNNINVPQEQPGLFVCTKSKAVERDAARGEAFRTFTSHRAESPVRAILTGGNADARKVAEGLQRYLEKIFGVLLPIDPAGVKAAPETGNIILIGREACAAAGLVTPQELAYVGPGGFVINAWQGRVALCGADAEGDAAAVNRYIEDHFACLFAPGVTKFTDLRGEWLHELYTVDKPWFAQRPAWERWWLDGGGQAASAPTEADIQAAAKLAQTVKDLARAERHDVPADVLKQAESSPLSRCVVARLMRDPFADATRIIREYQTACTPIR